MTERETAIQFHRDLLDLALAAGDRDSYERLLVDLFDRGVELGGEVWRQQRAGAAERELVAQRAMFDEAVKLAERRRGQLDQVERELATARAELEDLQLRLVDARVAS